MNGWKDDKAWADRFMHQIKGIIGQSLICEPPVEEDRERNTDLRVLRMDGVRIGCRVRHYDQQRYAGEFTIRASRPSGNKTELTKIIEGWGDYFFYGFANSEDTAVEKWIVGDLSAFRIWHSRELYRMKGCMPGMPKPNKDGSSAFRVFNSFSIPGFVVATDMPTTSQENAA